MKRPKVIMVGIGLVALASAGGITAASASGPPAARRDRRCRHAHGVGNRRGQDGDRRGHWPRPAAVLLPARHGDDVASHRRRGEAVAAADLARESQSPE